MKKATSMVIIKGIKTSRVPRPRISKIAPATQKGTAMGVYSSSQFFGAFAGGAVGGTVESAISSGGMPAARE